MRSKPILSLVLLAALGGFTSSAMANADLAKKYNCGGCHTPDKKLVGPSYKDIAAKYKGDAAAPAKLAEKVTKGGVGVWGQIPMPPNATAPAGDVAALVDWLLAGAK